MANLRPFLISFLVVGLFAFAMINGALLLESNNNATQSIGDDPTIASYKSSLESTLEDSSTNANSAETAIGDSPVTLTTGNIIFDAIGGIWKTLKVIPTTVYNLTIGLAMTKIFGSNSFGIVFGVIASILTITLIFGVWRMVTSGDSG